MDMIYLALLLPSLEVRAPPTKCKKSVVSASSSQPNVANQSTGIDRGKCGVEREWIASLFHGLPAALFSPSTLDSLPATIL
jgi:hypothetical protein